MTVHAAKGLEFPVTILSGMSTVPQARRGPAEVAFPADSDSGGDVPAILADATRAIVLLSQDYVQSPNAAELWKSGRLVARHHVHLRPRRRGADLADPAAVYADPARRDAATEALGAIGRAVGLRRLGPRITRAGGG